MMPFSMFLLLFLKLLLFWIVCISLTTSICTSYLLLEIFNIEQDGDFVFGVVTTTPKADFVVRSRLSRMVGSISRNEVDDVDANDRQSFNSKNENM